MKRKFTPIGGVEEEAAHLEADFLRARKIGALLAGERFLFYPGPLGVRYLAFESIAWAYMRREDSNMTMCCGRGTLASYYLVVKARSGEVKKAGLERESDVTALLDIIRQRNPAVAVGFNDENAARFA